MPGFDFLPSIQMAKLWNSVPGIQASGTLSKVKSIERKWAKTIPQWYKFFSSKHMDLIITSYYHHLNDAFLLLLLQQQAYGLVIIKNKIYKPVTYSGCHICLKKALCMKTLLLFGSSF